MKFSVSPCPCGSNALFGLIRACLFVSCCVVMTGCTIGNGLHPSSIQSSSPYPSLKESIDAILQERLLPQTGAGIKVISLKTGETVYEYHPLLLMTPASNLKLFTAAAALTLLGGDHPVETTVSLGKEGKRELYLKGCGDALLTTDDLRRLAATVSGSGIPAGEYRLVGDVSCFDDLSWGKGWIWDDEPDPDEMHISPLSVNGNAVTVAVRPGRKCGETAEVTLDPATSAVTLGNTATTSGAASTASLSILRRPGDRDNVISVSGTIPAGAPAVVKRLSVWRPESLVLSLFRDLLVADGIPVRETGFGTTPAGAELRAVKRRTVVELVAVMLRESDNLAAESLLKLMARKATRTAGSAEAGVREVRRYLEGRGIETAQQVIVDGSGVSRYNLTTAATIVRVLEEMYRDRRLFPLFFDSLAVAGNSGTLAHRMVNTPAEGQVRAKSGTMNGISALSGYLTTAGGEPLAFAIMIQNYAGSPKTAMEVQERICVLLRGFRKNGE